MSLNLTEKEIEALTLMRSGERMDRAAFSLDITVSALKFRLTSCRNKLNAKTTTHAVAEALSKGLIQ